MDDYLNEDAGGQNTVEPTSNGHAFVALLNACLDLADAGTIGASDAATKPDPILAAIATSESAEAAMTAFASSVAVVGWRMPSGPKRTPSSGTTRHPCGGVGHRAEHRRGPGRSRPLRGLQAELTFGPDWQAKARQEFSGDAFLALLAAVEAETGDGA